MIIGERRPETFVVLDDLEERMRFQHVMVGAFVAVACSPVGMAGADCPNVVGRWPYVPVQAVGSGLTFGDGFGTPILLLGSGSSLLAMDPTGNPATPVLLGSVTLPGEIRGIVLNEGASFAYVAAGDAGLRIINPWAIDRRVPGGQPELGHFQTRALNVALLWPLALVATGDVLGPCALLVLDVSDPTQPRQLGSWQPPNCPVTAVAARGQYAYVGFGGHGEVTPEWVSTLSLADPTSVAEISRVSVCDGPCGDASQIVLAGDLGLVATGTGVATLSLANPAAPRVLGRLETGGAFGVMVLGGTAYVAGGLGGLRVVDISDPTRPTLSGTLQTADEALTIAAAARNLYLGDRNGGLWILDISVCGVSGCSVSCTPVVPATGVAGGAVAFQGAYLSSGCTGTPSFDWDFGDGSPHSSEVNPSHTYPYGGTFRWALTVTLGGASATTSGAILIASTLAPITSPGSYAYVVPTSAHKDGFNGTHWVTDLVLTNPGLTDSVARLYFMRGRQDNTGSPARPVVVPLRRSLALSDVVASTFQQSGTSGAILVGSDVPLIVTSRTYNETASGTYGQFVRGAPIGEAFGPSAVGWLAGLAQSATDGVGFRTNIGIVNAGGQPVRVVVDLYGGDGVWLGSRTADLNPYDFQQLDKVYAGLSPSDVSAGYALLSTSTPDAVLFAYASVIDNSTGDPIAVPATAIPVGP